MSKPIEVTAKNFESEVLKSKMPVLVDFWASWCGPCQMMTPILEELATELEGKIKIVKLDTDAAENQTLARQYNIQSIPNLKIFRNSEVVKTLVGFRPKDTLLGELKKFGN